jgi:transglutaminase-like putative cysteine protease
MGWRLQVVHTTQVSYTAPVRASFNEARMTPLTIPAQSTLESRVTAGPGVPVWTYCDYWGTFVSVFDITDPHSSLVIRAQATVETGQDLTDAAPAPLPWAELRAQTASGRLLEFLMPTPLTTVTPDVAAAVVDAVRDADPAQAATEIAARVRAQVSYMAGSTGVRTNAQEAWDQGQGVCQDMAHLTVALLREAGLPARYVSGGGEPRLGGVLGRLLAAVRPDQRRPGARAPRRGGPGPRLPRHPPAQGHLPRRPDQLTRRDRRGHPPSLTGPSRHRSFRK